MKKELSVTPKDDLQKSLKNAINNIDKKIKILSGYVFYDKDLKPPSYLTNGRFVISMEEYPSSVNIFATVDIQYLLKCLCYISRLAKDYNEAAIDLNLQEYPVFKYLGFDLASWENDLKLRINKIISTEQIKSLEEIKNNLTSFLCEEDKLKEYLKKASSLLKK